MSGSHERGCVEAVPGRVRVLGVVPVALLVDAPLIAPPAPPISMPPPPGTVCLPVRPSLEARRSASRLLTQLRELDAMSWVSASPEGSRTFSSKSREWTAWEGQTRGLERSRGLEEAQSTAARQPPQGCQLRRQGDGHGVVGRGCP